MNSPLRFLRDRLAFRRPSGALGAADPLRLWRRDSANADPQLAAAALLEAMPRLLAGARDLPSRLHLLDVLEQEIDALLRLVELTIESSPLPLPPATHGLALVADNLLKLLARGHSSAIERQARHGVALEPTQLALARASAMRILARRQMLAIRAGAAGSEAAWRRLHTLFLQARRECSDADCVRRGERSYLAALLLLLANPGAQARSELPELAARCLQYAALANVVALGGDVGAARMATAEAHLIVRGDGPPRLLDDVRSLADNATALVVDCRQVLAQIDAELARRDPGADAQAPSLPTATHAMLMRLTTLWRRRPARRFARQSCKPRVDVVAGLDTLWWLLAGSGLSRRRGAAGMQGPAASMSEWLVVDESPDGFGLRSADDRAPRFAVGEIVAIRTRDSNALHVALVRRCDRRTLRVDLGIQALGREAVPVAVAVAGGSERALLLPGLPAWNGDAGIVAAPGRLVPGITFRHRRDDGDRDYRVAEFIEGSASCSLHRAEALATADSFARGDQRTGPGAEFDDPR